MTTVMLNVNVFQSLLPPSVSSLGDCLVEPAHIHLIGCSNKNLCYRSVNEVKLRTEKVMLHSIFAHLTLLLISPSWKQSIVLSDAIDSSSPKAGAAECQITCPEYFREGEENTVICIITRSATDDKCVDLHARPHLMFTSKSKDNYPLCIYSKSSKCGVCEDINDKETKCIFKVFGNRTLEGGDLECKVCSLWGSSKHEMNKGICKKHQNS
ncbi:uncharacterized protein LOC112568450 [Pomacea canaliculata]|uniref:uncharacterized protein LOC112568450 n=1 Tax=Pomacea canaliculata TaxID=400727 RepID=UPI000D728A2A|nr:uncharacterized protein LOC112568450 [Pomacea canaliculata]XP_025101540.1 uncharacterized protein LOC112568450 [Pomacea canaliculata]